MVAGLDGSRTTSCSSTSSRRSTATSTSAALDRRDRADGLLMMSLPTAATDLSRLAAAGVARRAGRRRGRGRPVGRGRRRRGRADGHPAPARARATSASPSSATTPQAARVPISADDREQGYAPGAGRRRRRGRAPSSSATAPHERGAARAIATGPARPATRRPPPSSPPSDVQALGVIEAAAVARARACPTTSRSIGFDDIELSAYVGLTTVRQPLFESGRLGDPAPPRGARRRHDPRRHVPRAPARARGAGDHRPRPGREAQRSDQPPPGGHTMTRTDDAEGRTDAPRLLHWRSASSAPPVPTTTTATRRRRRDGDGGGCAAATMVTIFGPEVEVEAQGLARLLRRLRGGDRHHIEYSGDRSFEEQIGGQVDGGDAPDIAMFPQPGKIADFQEDLVPLPTTIADTFDRELRRRLARAGHHRR